ncbi:MAG: hypothetical protein KGI08_10700, partial [Thaumarchaeota archaeon]|nr:hypothetical protein [Nitrososphaerota archaeon]
NPESKHPRYYFKISLDDDGFVKTPSIANDAKKLLRFEVYDNPKFTPSQKAEISAPYIFNLLNELSKLNQKNMIDGFSKKVTDSSEVRFAEGMIRLNFKFAEKYGFDKQLYKKLNALIGSPYDKKTVKNVNQQTKFLYNKFKKNN